ncbi:MAG: V-type ATP synthase subunit I [Meiothermus sp.]|uniref:V-type ATP synthase subunit I n=1 Tax=Meiothermus sp. TaxID=1955249 RepID=UPI0025E6667D|nr:V-type ATPase 116kDa subunit family protein [Meiothermus sp.]MCS7058439.1 V-type ATP synthase subunit I [Meiothermus sp.]MCS7195059.1 V-type ATP synthase subunit I [Meiothermus sp.]MCX7739597.1 V-type ATP synthase subunit I [Meiothermus sp.]MDW8090833.1 V-type ATPase 116kDa subunit family protein [Meiothermus sp.]MDW8482472.1 V-type ATPase 116kDa subunit family protein [Meiothermus sp.]
MEKLIVAGPKRLARALLAELQKAGVVHIDPLRPDELGEYRLTPEEEAELRRWEVVLSQAEQALTVAGVPLEPSSKAFPGSLEEAEATVRPAAERAAVLGKERALLEEELQATELFGKVAERLDALVQGLDQSRWLAVVPFLLGRPEELAPVQAALQQGLAERFVLEAEPLGNQVLAVLVVRRGELEVARSVLSRLGLTELRFPGVYGGLPLAQVAARMKERARLAPEELQGIREELARLARESGEALVEVWTRAKDEVARYRAASDLAAGRYGMALMGWVPQKAKGQVEEALSRLRDQIVYTFEPVDEHHEGHQVPVTLENPSWAKPFELLHGFLNTPRYGGYDPTLMMALFFPLFFGVVVGDIGIGLLFLLLALWLARKAQRGEALRIDFLGASFSPEVLAKLAVVGKWMAGWAILWGFLYGEFFGTFLEKLRLPAMFGLPEGWRVFYPTGPGYDPEKYYGLFPILINRLDFTQTANGLMVFAISFGVIQVLYAFFLRMRLGLRHGHSKHFWEGFGYLAGLVGLVAFAYNFLTQANSALLNLVFALGIALFLVGVVQAREPLMIAELPGKGGQILSYIRLYAVGVAGGVLASLANQVGFGLAERFGFLGGVLGFVVGAILIALIIIITTLGHVIQPIRLLWIEFSTNFGFFEESGRPYRPFKSVRSR